jgi:hypothetical protein
MAVRARWDPGWYTRDQSLEVGRRARFAFYPPEPGGGGELVFGNTVGREWDMWEATVEAIEHARLGALHEVDASGFGEYTFRFADGRWVTIEAEQDLGRVNGASPDFPVDRVDRGWADAGGWALDVTLAGVASTGGVTP